MDKIELTVRYWCRRIIPAALRVSGSPKEIGGRVMGVIVQFIVAVILVAGFGLSGQIPNFGVNVITGLLILVVFVVLRFLWNVIYLPAKIFAEQGGFVENPFEITKVTNNLSPSNTEYVNIKITNKSKVGKIEDCYVELTSVIDLTTDQETWAETQKLFWSTRELSERKHERKSITLNPDSPAWCDIAVAIIGGKAYYLVWFADAIYNKIRPGKYRLTLKVHGEWQEHPISYPYRLDLTYQPDNETKFVIENIGEIKV